MRTSITYFPHQLQNPAQVRAHTRFQAVNEKIQDAKATLLEIDNDTPIDHNPQDGVVLVDKYRSPERETFTGEVGPDRVSLDSTKRESDYFGSRYTKSNYQATGDKTFSLTRQVSGEEAHGRYHGVEFNSYTSESFTMNDDGSVTYERNSTRRSRGVGEW